MKSPLQLDTTSWKGFYYGKANKRTYIETKMPQTGILFFGNRRFNRIWNTKTFVREQIRQAGNLLQTKKFITIHANIFHNPLVGHTRFIQFGHDVALSSILCEPRARLCRMVDAIRLDNSLSITTTGNKPFSR